MRWIKETLISTDLFVHQQPWMLYDDITLLKSIRDMKNDIVVK